MTLISLFPPLQQFKPSPLLDCSLNYFLFIAAQPLFFILKGVRHENNTAISVDELGQDDDALMAITPNPDCCRGLIRLGEFYYPDGSMVPINSAGQSLYRNRDNQLIRLHRRDQTNSASIPRGEYRAELPDACGDKASLYVTLGKYHEHC